MNHNVLMTMSGLVNCEDVKWTDKHGDVRGPLCNVDYETLECTGFRWTSDEQVAKYA